MIRNNSILALILLLAVQTSLFSQKATSSDILIVGFYNLENLFDTINQEEVNDEEYTPEGKNNWTHQRYTSKLNNMSRAIADIGSKDGALNGPDILGVCEVENLSVLDDLTKHATLAPEHYQIVHFDSPDKRGIDVALLYKKNAFEVLHTKTYKLNLTNPVTGESIETRDQLVVSGKIKKQKISILVNHWPSRMGGELRSQPLRLAAAQLSRHIIDSLLEADSLANIIVMGDFNDDPTNLSTKDYLQANFFADSLAKEQLYNPSASIFMQGKGSLQYRGKWNMFDQIFLSGNLLTENKKEYSFSHFEVENTPYLFEQEGKFKGYPHRTFAGGNFLNGFSDHLPVYIVLKHQ